MSTVAGDVASWFAHVLDIVGRTIDATSGDERHRTVALRSVLTRNARIVVASSPQVGAALVRPTVLVLAAASRLLGITPGEREWLAALDNARSLAKQMRELFEEQPNAEPLLDGPVGVFKVQFDETLIQAGVTGEPTNLAAENRRLALGLAVNWGMRFLVTHARGLEPDAQQDKPTRELLGLLARAA